MKLEDYIDMFNAPGKRFYLLTVTPTGSYPKRFDSKGFEHFILKSPKSYLYIYEPDSPEMMHQAAFKFFILPLISDKYDMIHREDKPVKRLNKKEILAYFVLEEFYDKVPSGKLSEEEAIKIGKQNAEKFILAHPLEDFEYGFISISKNDDEVQTLMQIDFVKDNTNYIFKYVYVC